MIRFFNETLLYLAKIPPPTGPFTPCHPFCVPEPFLRVRFCITEVPELGSVIDMTELVVFPSIIVFNLSCPNKWTALERNFIFSTYVPFEIKMLSWFEAKLTAAWIELNGSPLEPEADIIFPSGLTYHLVWFSGLLYWK